MNSVLIFIVVLGILIFFHELGHFLTARFFGVGVEKFSLGFGPRLIGRTIGRTDYRISLIPLGGYVKMVGDEPDAPIAPEDVAISFTHKHVLKRACIVAAGPIFNILLAVLIFTVGLLFTGLPSIKPVVRSVESNSPAQASGVREGDRVKTIDGRVVMSWRDIDQALDGSQGRPLKLTVDRHGEELRFEITPARSNAKNLFGDDFTYFDLGIKGFKELSAVVDEAVPDMPAALAGIQKGDRIVAIDGHPIDNWEMMQEMVSASKGRTMTFEIARGEQTISVPITPAQVQETDVLGAKQVAYRIGIRRAGITIPEQDQIKVHLGLLGSLGQGVQQTWDMVEATGYSFVKIIERKVPAESLGGPILIAQMAHQEAQQGILRLFYFIAIISVNLAVLNLLPIPVLDGGHILFYIIESILRRPVNPRVREAAQQVGILLLVMLMIFVFYNDITRTWFK